jgi:AraC-like DNA-binding protein
MVNRQRRPGLDAAPSELDTFAMIQPAIGDAFVPRGFVLLLRDYARDKGIERHLQFDLQDEAVRPHPLDPYPAARFHELLARCSTLLKDPHFGLNFGRSFRTPYLGALGYVLATSDALLDAMNRLQRYVPLVSNIDDIAVWSDARNLVIEWKDTHRFFGPRYGDIGVICFVQAYRDIRGADDPFPRIDLPCKTPQDPSPYRDYLGGEVRFECDTARIYVPQDYLARPFKTRDPALRELLEAQVEEALKAGDEAQMLRNQVRRQVTRLAYERSVSLKQVAAGLGVSERQLRHQLALAGVSFRDICSEVLCRLAQLHLSDPEQTVHDVGQLLGYSEHSAFTRAFRGWTGESPRSFRQRLAGRKPVQSGGASRT